MTRRSAQSPVPRPRRADGEATERRLLEVALDLFRGRGLDGATMRDIAAGAGLSLGAAYHYFPSKESIVLAYYQRTQREHRQHIEKELAATRGLRERLRLVLRSKLEILRRDRRLLGALFRFAGDPESPVSVFAKGTADVRAESIGLISMALDTPEVPAEARAPLATALWAVHLGLLLFFLHDTSPRQQRTWQLVDDVTDLFADLAPLAAMPGALAIGNRVLTILDRAGIKTS